MENLVYRMARTFCPGFFVIKIKNNRLIMFIVKSDYE